ncbi:BURP domain-containing protein 9-like [Chenopodium quinoa]|uniref:BURP domain-containing protein 9-like n=1 Tax=Chenopodium quinoa TaxID=63459 RepID=UPI000B771C35|nr:BURP domain-containing protein 9-like [Chenopodium quinoa]
MMANLLSFLLFFLALVRMGSPAPASISPEAYWKLKLPYTPMLQSIKDSLPPAGPSMNMPLKEFRPSAKASLASIDGPYIGLLSYNKKSLTSSNPSYLSYDKQGLGSSNPRYLSYNKNGLDSVNPKYLSYNKQGLDSKNPSYLSYKKQGLDSLNPKYLSYNKQGLNSNNPNYLSYNKQGLDSLDPKYLSYNKQGLQSRSPKYLAYNKQGLNSNNPKYLSYTKPDHAEESFHVDDNASSKTKDRVFFVEKDLHVGAKKTLHFQKSVKKGLFLPREVSNQIPFSSDKVEETLQILSLDPKSKEAYVLSKRIELCEEPTIEGVEKKCVTSLESMVDYVISKIGTNVKALTTQVEKDSTTENTIKGLKKLVKDDRETVVCHKIGYPYAVFFCHRTKTIRSYMASLVGKDGTNIEAVVACHMETNDFLDNYAKNVLKIVPGSTHICHFPAAEDTIIWVPK